MDTTLTKFGHVRIDSGLESNNHLVGLWTKDLPEQDYRSSYALDAARILSGFLDADKLGVKTSRLKTNHSWEALHPPLSLAVAIIFLTAQSKQKSLFTERNSQYLRTTLGKKFPPLVDLILRPSDDVFPDWAIAAFRSSRIINEAALKSQLRRTHKSELEQSLMLAPEMNFCFQWMFNYLNSAGFAGDFLEPLCSIPNADILRHSDEPLPPNASEVSELKSHPLAGLSNAGTAISQYEQWVRYCKECAALQRIPERLIVDLIPPVEIADHSLKNASVWEDALEETFPGRRQWLLDEGVTRRDFDTFWGFPSWVQNFIEALMKRNLTLELQGQRDIGKSEEESTMLTAMFIPFFDVQYRDSSPELRPLPIELFERVRRYAASLGDDWQTEFVSGGFASFNQYLRMCIQQNRF